MRSMIKGITVTLITKKEVGRDPFNRPIYEDVEIEVDNVLVSPVSTEDIVHTLELTGNKAVYTLAVTRGDENDSEYAEVIFFGQIWRTIAFPTEGINHFSSL